jgi:hypothetical protein
MNQENAISRLLSLQLHFLTKMIPHSLQNVKMTSRTVADFWSHLEGMESDLQGVCGVMDCTATCVCEVWPSGGLRCDGLYCYLCLRSVTFRGSAVWWTILLLVFAKCDLQGVCGVMDFTATCVCEVWPSGGLRCDGLHCYLCLRSVSLCCWPEKLTPFVCKCMYTSDVGSVRQDYAVKVKVTPWHLCWHRGKAEVRLQSIRNPALQGGGWSAPHSGRFTPCKDPVPIVQEATLGLEAGQDDTENFAPTGSRSPDHTARSELQIIQYLQLMLE